MSLVHAKIAPELKRNVHPRKIAPIRHVPGNSSPTYLHWKLAADFVYRCFRLKKACVFPARVKRKRRSPNAARCAMLLHYSLITN